MNVRRTLGVVALALATLLSTPVDAQWWRWWTPAPQQGQTPVDPDPPIDCDRTAASNAVADIQAEFALAVTDDVVCVPAGSGTVTWTDGLGILTKRLHIAGPGRDALTVTLDTASIVRFQNTNSSISGFTFQSANNLASTNWIESYGRSGATRIYGNRFINTTGSSRRCVYFNSQSAGHATALLYDNIFENCRVSAVGDLSTVFGENEWENPVDLATYNRCIYLEDNSFTYTQFGNHMEIDYGGCMVERFGTIEGSGDTNIHGTGGGQDHGGRQFEIYGNDYSNQFGDVEMGVWVRSGSGLIFWNSFDSTYATPLTFDIHDNRGGTAGECDGDAGVDGNLGDGVSNPIGWPCMDQPGFYKVDNEFSTAGPNTWLARAIGLWGNRTSGSTITGVNFNGGNNAQYIRNGYEFQQENASFDGTLGTGVGAIGSRPGTCTTGVYYWATDEGSWNTESTALHATHAANHTEGADGLLYKCTSTNTWTLFYTPYAYPHPNRGE